MRSAVNENRWFRVRSATARNPGRKPAFTSQEQGGFVNRSDRCDRGPCRHSGRIARTQSRPDGFEVIDQPSRPAGSKNGGTERCRGYGEESKRGEGAPLTRPSLERTIQHGTPPRIYSDQRRRDDYPRQDSRSGWSSVRPWLLSRKWQSSPGDRHIQPRNDRAGILIQINDIVGPLSQ